MASGLQAQWDATYGPTLFSGASNPSVTDPVHFQQRVSIAVTTAAVAIASEATGVTDHTNRVLLAKAVLGNPLPWITPFAQACASQGLDQSSNDAAISNMIAAVWNGFAGAL